jgi:hypothetical protein
MRPPGPVDDDLAVALADAVDDVAVELDVHRRPAGGRVAHVDVDRSRALLGRGQAIVGDLRRRDRQVRRLLGAGQVAGDGAGEEAGVHGGVQRWRPPSTTRRVPVM